VSLVSGGGPVIRPVHGLPRSVLGSTMLPASCAALGGLDLERPNPCWPLTRSALYVSAPTSAGRVSSAGTGHHPAGARRDAAGTFHPSEVRRRAAGEQPVVRGAAWIGSTISPRSSNANAPKSGVCVASG